MATKVDIFSGFLGAGKTTLIKKLIADGYNGQKIVLIENEFGQIGIDGGFLKESGIEITEMNSGCICCSLVGDFGTALKEVIDKYAPDRILIEPSGVGKLSDVVAAVKKVEGTEICGTNTLYEDASIETAEKGLTGVVRFTQRMTLQGGEYLLSLGLTGYLDGELHAYHRLYDICNLQVLADVIKVGYFDMESKVQYDDVRAED